MALQVHLILGSAVNVLPNLAPHSIVVQIVVILVCPAGAVGVEYTSGFELEGVWADLRWERVRTEKRSDCSGCQALSRPWRSGLPMPVVDP
ncbi:uncharacterized protein PG986_002462 [Apiospora aurea]|uniref:Secreted protein n=1 Tax=Apiospora aurea TaxID=335848 RepID=A0ABR1QNX7_9PEZI